MIKHQDESSVSIGETFTLDLTPDKNAELEAVKGGADNVQVLGEALNEKIDKTNENTIFKYQNNIEILTNDVFVENGVEYPIYLKIINSQYNFIQDDVYHYFSIPDIRLQRIFEVLECYQISSGEWFYSGAFINGDGNFIRLSTGNIGKSLGIGYRLFRGLSIKFTGYRILIKYQKEVN